MRKFVVFNAIQPLNTGAIAPQKLVEKQVMDWFEGPGQGVKILSVQQSEGLTSHQAGGSIKVIGSFSISVVFDDGEVAL